MSKHKPYDEAWKRKMMEKSKQEVVDCAAEIGNSTVRHHDKERLAALARPLMEYLANELQPYGIAIVTTTDVWIYDAEGSSGEILDYVQD